MNVEIVKEENILDVKKIWKSVFEDSNEYIDLYFNDMFQEGNALAVYDGDKPVSMLFLNPVTLVLGKSRYRLNYVYAIATLAEHRGKGNASVLLRFAELISSDRGFDGMCLQPADLGLTFFYTKMGYESVFTPDSPIENYIDYPHEYLRHIKNVALLEQNSQFEVTRESFDRTMPKGMLKRLNDRIPLGITAFMAYPMD